MIMSFRQANDASLTLDEKDIAIAQEEDSVQIQDIIFKFNRANDIESNSQ